MVLDIKPGIGIGEIKFGLRRAQVVKVIGRADEIEEDKYEEDGQLIKSEDWHYDEYEMSLSFDEDENWLLTTIAISSGQVTLAGVPMMGMGEAGLVDILRNMGIEDLEYEDLSDRDNPNTLRVSSDEYGISFWFEEGELTEIQCSPLLNEHGEIDWPE